MADPQRVVRGLRRRLGRVRRALRRSESSGRARVAAGTGTPRVATVEPTNVGPVFDEAVARVRSRMTPAGVDAGYDLAYESFDLQHFLLQARHVLESDRIDPLKVFLTNGAGAQASPEINFDMAAYLARHPERADGPERSPYLAWLRHGRAAGEIADPAPGLEKMAPVLGLSEDELVGVLAETRLDLQERLRSGTLGRMLASAAEIEPLIGDVWSVTAAPLIPPLASANTVDQVSALHRCHARAGHTRARVLIVAPHPRWGGGRRVEGHIAHALAGRIDPAEIVVVYTDTSGAAPPGRFPDGVREVDFAAVTEGMEEPAVRRALVELVRSFCADAVVNVNSRVLYEALAVYGPALGASERVFLMMFCNEQLALGNWVGIPLRFFYRCFDLVEGVLTDSQYLADWLRDRHQLGHLADERMHVLRAPVDTDLRLVDPPSDDPARRRQVFWAGRWDRQKRVDLAVEVARQLPEVDVRMWGESVLTRGRLGDVPPNVRLEGRYDHISHLPLTEADVWLYTSAWDGAPSQLLEVGMTGIPLVGTLVGGTGEVLSDQDAWPVAEVDDAGAYVRAIREVLADPERARARSAALRERLLRERSAAAYAEQVAELLLRDDLEGAGR